MYKEIERGDKRECVHGSAKAVRVPGLYVLINTEIERFETLETLIFRILRFIISYASRFHIQQPKRRYKAGI